MVKMNGFWDTILDKVAGSGLARKLHITKLEKIYQAALEHNKCSSTPGSQAPSKNKHILERTCSSAIRHADAESRHSRIQLLSDKWVVSAPKGAGTECYPLGFNGGVLEGGHDPFSEYDDTMADRALSPCPPFPEIAVRRCCETANDGEYVRLPDFIADNYSSLYPVVVPGIEKEPGFPGWKQLHDKLEELYLRNHGPDIWQIKRSVKGIMRGDKPDQQRSWSTMSTKTDSPLWPSAQSNMLRNQNLFSNYSSRAKGKGRAPALSFSKIMSSPGTSRVSALTSLLHDEPPEIEAQNLTAPTPLTVLEDMVKDLGGKEQGYSAILSGCAIESYTPPGDRQSPQYSPSPPSWSELNEALQPIFLTDLGRMLKEIRALRDERLRNGIFTDECAMVSYTPSEDWDPLGWRTSGADLSSEEETPEICSVDNDNSEWEGVQDTADTLTPPLPPPDSPIIYPSPEIKPRIDMVPLAPARKAMRPRELIKVGKRRIYRRVRPKHLRNV